MIESYSKRLHAASTAFYEKGSVLTWEFGPDLSGNDLAMIENESGFPLPLDIRRSLSEINGMKITLRRRDHETDVPFLLELLSASRIYHVASEIWAMDLIDNPPARSSLFPIATDVYGDHVVCIIEDEQPIYRFLIPDFFTPWQSWPIVGNSYSTYRDTIINTFTSGHFYRLAPEGW